ncbi:MAG: CcmD family protein [Bacteroidia bacterium]
MKKISLSILFLSLISQINAQNNESLFRSSGKIYVVVGIIAIIFILIVLYLIRLDRKISNLEKGKK